MSSHGRFRRSTATSVALLVALLAPHAGLAQDASTTPLQVSVQAVGPSGVAGIALLAPSASGTAVQVLVVGAPAGTTAVIHPGGCAAPNATLVALLGDVGASGQVQVTVPVAFEALTDGGHVIALHPGLDMTTQVGCGAIPAVVAPMPDGPEASAAPQTAPVVALPTPEPISEPTPVPPTATLDPACAGLEPWIKSTEGRTSRIAEALADLNTVAGRSDLAAYLAGLASLEGELRVMVTRQSEELAPESASDVNAQAVTAYETYIDAARQIYDALTTSLDPNMYSRGLSRYQEATTLIGEVQRDIGELKARCATG